jgi:SAM-dependent methyltransferase
MLRRTTLVLISLALVPAGALAQQAPRTPVEAPSRVPDVPFVPTDDAVVSKMLSITKVGKNDVVYDLGCGDGRIVIAAAKQHGARGVGVDINPVRIAESKENARLAGVTDKVRFVEEDLYKMNISDATVVTLYLLPDVNIKLRPRLLDELRPGTRIASHDFHMGDWQPDKTVEVAGATVYYWVVPAKVAGNWQLEGAQGQRPRSLELTQQFQEVSGMVREGDRAAPLTNVKLQGAELSFTLPSTNGTGAGRFIGRVNGDALDGKITMLADPKTTRDLRARRLNGKSAARTRP